MLKIEIMLIVSVVEIAELKEFDLEELSEFWSALTVCRDDSDFFAEFNAKEQKAILDALKKIETELRHRHKEPVNLFQLMEENPAQVERYLDQFDLYKLLELEAELKEFKKSAIVADFLKLVRKKIYNLIPVS